MYEPGFPWKQASEQRRQERAYTLYEKVSYTDALHVIMSSEGGGREVL